MVEKSKEPVLQQIVGKVEVAMPTKSGNGINYKLGEQWFWAEKSRPVFKVGEEVLVNFEVKAGKDGDRDFNLVHSIEALPVVGGVIKATVSDFDVFQDQLYTSDKDVTRNRCLCMIAWQLKRLADK